MNKKRIMFVLFALLFVPLLPAALYRIKSKNIPVTKNNVIWIRKT